MSHPDPAPPDARVPSAAPDDAASDASREAIRARTRAVAERVARAPSLPAARADAPPDEVQDDKYAAYASTVLDFPGPPPLRLDLRRPLPGDVRERLAALGLDGPFAVLTVENPEGANAEDADDAATERAQRRVNRARTRTLSDALDEAALDWAPVTGHAPDGSYPERCAAVRLPLAEARRLASTARQLALFWFDGTAVWLVPVEAEGAPRRLPER
jgi:hypothetical protein